MAAKRELPGIEGAQNFAAAAGHAGAALRRPLLRGYLHLGGAVLTVGATVLLIALAGNDFATRLAIVIYGICAEILFAVSALYHIGTWQPGIRAILRRLDHANIFLLIAGTYTPIAVTVLSGGWREGMLVAIWVLAVAGIIANALGLPLPRWASVSLYILTGSIAIAAIPQFAARVGLGGVLLLALGGVLYTIGAMAYATRRPNPWPRVFGYHEVFHAFTLAANAAFFSFMLLHVV